jgi:septum formation protein
MINTKHPIYLASKSPRRYEILKNAGFDFQIMNQDYNETIPSNMDSELIPLCLANLKLNSLSTKVDNKIVICADTLVILSNGYLGKPKNKTEAKLMLNQLSDSTHKVITGVSIGTPSGLIEIVDTSKVTFKKLDDWEIDLYVENFQPFDKAGSYGIQDFIGMIGVTHIKGSFYNIMGLPIHRVYEALKPFILK